MIKWLREISKSMRGRSWKAHCFGVALMLALFVEIVQLEPETFSILYPLQVMMLGAHELAHLVTGWLPKLLTASAGSFVELLIPLALIVYALKSRNFITSLFLVLWLNLSMSSIGAYMADARAGKLSLVSVDSALGGDSAIIHDWKYIFENLGIIKLDAAIGLITKYIGYSFSVMVIVLYGYFVYVMYKNRRWRDGETSQDLVVANAVESPKSNVLYSSSPVDAKHQ